MICFKNIHFSCYGCSFVIQYVIKPNNLFTSKNKEFYTNMTIRNDNKSGFTLVELAIVIVIVGLLVGGTLQGQELIAQSKVRATVVNVQSYLSAINSFRGKYNTWPGDFSRASTMLSSAGIDGGGNGSIDTTAEKLAAWQHLTLSKLIKGSYSGVTTGSALADPLGIDPGVNTPPQAFSETTIAFHSYTLYNINKDALWMSGRTMQSGYYLNKGAVTPEVAMTIDIKMDDGSAGSGMVIAYHSNDSYTCTTGYWWTGTTNVDYLTTNKTPTCRMTFYWY